MRRSRAFYISQGPLTQKCSAASINNQISSGSSPGKSEGHEDTVEISIAVQQKGEAAACVRKPARVLCIEYSVNKEE